MHIYSPVVAFCLMLLYVRNQASEQVSELLKYAGVLSTSADKYVRYFSR